MKPFDIDMTPFVILNCQKCGTATMAPIRNDVIPEGVICKKCGTPPPKPIPATPGEVIPLFGGSDGSD